MIEMLENYLDNGYVMETMDINAEDERKIEINLTLRQREWDY